MKSSDIDIAQLPLCENTPTEEVNEGDREDDFTVLNTGNGILNSRSIGKRALYLVQPHLRQLKVNCRWRQGAVLGLGVFLTVIALTLVVVGAVRSREHTSFKLLHIKQPIDLKSLLDIGDENFTFAQLLALRNLAVDKKAAMSSVSKRDSEEKEADRGSADKAVDGNVTTCSRSGLERSPFWYVDILREKVVNSVRIQGSNSNKLHDLRVFVSVTSNSTAQTDLCGGIDGETKTRDIRVACARKMPGRYITIELQTKANTYESLVLCEVMVFE